MSTRGAYETSRKGGLTAALHRVEENEVV